VGLLRIPDSERNRDCYANCPEALFELIRESQGAPQSHHSLREFLSFTARKTRSFAQYRTDTEKARARVKVPTQVLAIPESPRGGATTRPPSSCFRRDSFGIIDDITRLCSPIRARCTVNSESSITNHHRCDCMPFLVTDKQIPRDGCLKMGVWQ
jgi:hypothetical protein